MSILMPATPSLVAGTPVGRQGPHSVDFPSTPLGGPRRPAPFDLFKLRKMGGRELIACPRPQYPTGTVGVLSARQRIRKCVDET